MVATNDKTSVNGSSATTGTWAVKKGLAQMLKGGVIMDVVTPEHADRRATGLDAFLHHCAVLDHERDRACRHGLGALASHLRPPTRPCDHRASLRGPASP